MANSIDGFRSTTPIRPPTDQNKNNQPLDYRTKTEESFRSTRTNYSNFITPDQAAARDALKVKTNADISNYDNPTSQTSFNTTNNLDHSQKPSKKKAWYKRLKPYWPPDKKEILTIVAIFILLSISSIGGFLLLNHQTTKKVVADTQTKPKTKAIPINQSNTVPSNLTGLPVNPSVNNRPVTGVMIENSIFARPQAGLSQAGVVYEALTEGGITRFLALYQDSQPNNVGPIRSARPYFLQWDLQFDAALAHVGGSPQALNDIKIWQVRNLDQMFYGNYYHRISSRYAPHNVYTPISTLNQLEAKLGYTSSTFTPWPRKPDSPSKQVTAGVINFILSSSTYDVQYNYDSATNSYNRSEGGAPQIDANTNTQLSPKVVIAMVIAHSLEADGYHSQYAVIGSGPVYVFQDGTVTTGQWSKTSNNAQMQFTNNQGQPIKLNAGQTWITAVNNSKYVNYKP